MENTTNNPTPKKSIQCEPIDFKSVGDLKITTTEKLGELINDLLMVSFKDYHGCKLQVSMEPTYGRYFIVPTLYFQVLPENQYDTGITAFKPLNKMSGDNFIQRANRLTASSINPGPKVNFTEDGKEMLEDIMMNPSRGKKIDWNACFNTMPTDVGTYIEVGKIDLNKLVRKIFGSKMDGSELFYQITPTYKLNVVNSYRENDIWALNILRLNEENEIEAAKALGMYVPRKSGINVITATSH